MAHIPSKVYPFRINTYKSLSKQMSLSSFRMNTYKKPGGRVRIASAEILPRRVSSRRRGFPALSYPCCYIL